MRKHSASRMFEAGANKKTQLGMVGILSGIVTLPLPLLAQDAYELPEVTVQGETLEESMSYRIDADTADATAPDTGELLRRIPGANVNRNGTLSGIAQYRGMYGDRINVMIDGMFINSGGPNAMDAPLSYATRPLLDSLEVVRGIAPVSSGIETIGGTVRANTKRSEFGDTEKLAATIDVDASANSVNDGTAVGTLWSVANNRHRGHVTGSTEHGSHIESGDNTIFPTRHRRDTYGLGYGFRSGLHELSFDLRRNETDETGTPALPMDIVYIDSNIGQAEYNGDLAGLGVRARVSYSDVDHKMANFVLRQPPPMQRFALTASKGRGYGFDVGIPLADGELLVGVDGHLGDHDALIKDPTNAMFLVDSYNDTERDLYGLFAEWTGSFWEGGDLQLGARYNRVEMDTGEVFHSMAMMNPNILSLQTTFNNADREQTDDNIDLVAQLGHDFRPGLRGTLGLARKTRSPSYQERYLWIPLQSTGGLADGNNYVGDINLEPEVSYQIELGLDWRAPKGYLAPRVFYRKVDDYIQGAPATDTFVTNIDPNALQFSNVDAKLYGLDADWGFHFTKQWHLDGVISYVRGERDDIDDNLYRIAPLNALVALSYQRERWSVAAEGVFYDRQDEVSETNRETETPGYALMHLRGRYAFAKHTTLQGGVENVFDREYVDHLTGVNRVLNSDIAFGDRIPGAGRNFYVQVSHRFD